MSLSRSVSAPQLLALVGAATLFACGASAPTTPPPPNLGTPLFDSSVEVIDYALTADGTTAYALTETGPVGNPTPWQIASIDLATRAAGTPYTLPNDAQRLAMQQVGSAGNFYYVRYWAGISVVRINPSKSDYSETVVWNDPQAADPDDVTYVVSPDERYVSVFDDVKGSVLAHDGQETQLDDVVAAFSPDSTQLVFLDTLQIYDIATGTTQSWTPPHAIALPQNNVVRWSDGGLYALTGDGKTIYLDDLLHQTSRPLWPEKTLSFFWSDDAHVFEFDGTCDEMTAGGSCHGVAFDLFYRGVDSAADSSQVANGHLSTGGKPQLLPGGNQFIWFDDGSLLLQDR
jgi:hypothetical protein